MIFLAILLAFPALPWLASAMRADHLAKLRQETVDMFHHGFSNYMLHAFPEDELRPVTCKPLTRSRETMADPGLNDVLANYSLTLIDSLSTLAILAGGPTNGKYTGAQALADFQDGVEQFVQHYGDGRPGPSGRGLRARGFDLDSKVQVFETVIRGVGGLLSAHLFAVGHLPIRGYEPKPGLGSSSHDNDDNDDDNDPLETPPIAWPGGFRYDGQLLRLALDLAQRLLPAFYTMTGIPYPRVNLRSGIPFYANSPLHQNAAGEDAEPLTGGAETTETCSAGAGSLTLEFTVLSRLSGDPRFEQAAKRAFWEVWERRSDIGLIGNGIDAERGVWIGPHSGIGAGIDSFFEYALKSHILLSGQDALNVSQSPRRSKTSWLDPNSLHPPLPHQMHSSDAFLEAWHQAHASVKRYIYTDRNHFPYYSNSHRATGQPYTMWIDSLAAFYPGLLALAGEIDEAIEANLVYTALWTRYSAIPERWSIRESNVEPGIAWWPGRPEFIESTYHIYRATTDPWYLRVGEMVLRDIKRRCWAPCGWAGLEDVRSGEKQDRMESFFLGETTKYLYLLFDPQHPLNNLDAAYVFTTEGHPLIIPPKLRQPQSRRSARRQRTASSGGETDVAGYKYFDSRFTNACPAPRKPADPLAGSITAARRNLFDVSLLTNLYKTPNLRGPVETYEVRDEEQGLLVTRHRATSNHTVFPWTLPPTMLPHDGTCPAPVDRIFSWIQFPTAPVATTPEDASALSFLERLFESQPQPPPLSPPPPPLLRWSQDMGPLVQRLDGLRLQMERDSRGAAGGAGDDVWVVTSAAGSLLRREERLLFHAEHVAHFTDEAFSVLRRSDVVDVLLLLEKTEPRSHTTSEETEAETETEGKTEAGAKRSLASMPLVASELGSRGDTTATAAAATGSDSYEKASSVRASDEPPADNQESLLRSILRAMSSALDPLSAKESGKQPLSSLSSLSSGSIPSNRRPVGAGAGADTLDDETEPRIFKFKARTATGPGAIRLPSVADAMLPTSPGFLAAEPAASFPWRRWRRRRRSRRDGDDGDDDNDDDDDDGIYMAGLACDGPLPESAPRKNKVIVMLRGGCSFAEKLANIPSFIATTTTTTTSVNNNSSSCSSSSSNNRSSSRSSNNSSSRSLQLVIVIDEGGSFANAPRPLLETPPPPPRARIPMVMVSGPLGTYDLFMRASAVGLRRSYVVKSQGYVIENAVVV